MASGTPEPAQGCADVAGRDHMQDALLAEHCLKVWGLRV